MARVAASGETCGRPVVARSETGHHRPATNRSCGAGDQRTAGNGQSDVGFSVRKFMRVPKLCAPDISRPQVSGSTMYEVAILSHAIAVSTSAGRKMRIFPIFFATAPIGRLLHKSHISYGKYHKMACAAGFLRLKAPFQSSKFKVQSSKFKVQSSKFKVQSSKFKVHSSTPALRHSTLATRPSTLELFTLLTVR